MHWSEVFANKIKGYFTTVYPKRHTQGQAMFFSVFVPSMFEHPATLVTLQCNRTPDVMFTNRLSCSKYNVKQLSDGYSTTTLTALMHPGFRNIAVSPMGAVSFVHNNFYIT